MAIPFPPPPDDLRDETEIFRWLRVLWRKVRGETSTSGDEAYTIPSASTYHGVTALSAPRTLTLPDSKSMTDGDEVVVQDESGSAGSQTITIAAGGTDTVYGTATITSNYGRRRVIKRGSGKYYAQ